MCKQTAHVLVMMISGCLLSSCQPQRPANLYEERIDAEVASKNWINEEGEVNIYVDQTLSNEALFDQEADRLNQKCLETPRTERKPSKSAHTPPSRYNTASYFCDRFDIKLVNDNGQSFLIKPKRACAWAEDERLFICQEVAITSDYATRDQWSEAKRSTRVFRYE